MAISFIGQATGTNTATMPAHQAGDLILVFAYNGAAATTPTLVSGFTSISNGAANTNAHQLAWKIAASSSEVIGTWTNATDVIVHVYRGCLTGSPIGGNGNGTNAGTTVAYPALTMAVATGSSWIAAFAGYRSATSTLESPPTGLTNRSDHVNSGSGAEAAGHDTNAGVTSYAGSSANVGGSGFRYRAVSVELKAATSNAYTLSAVGGSIAITGTVATLKRGTRVVAATSSIAVTGQAATFRKGFGFVANAGSIAIVGSDATFKLGRRVVAAAGSLSIVGQNATLKKGIRFTADAGSITATGTTANLRIGRKVIAASGSIAISGQVASVKRSIRLVALEGSVSIAGQACTLKFGHRVVAQSGNVSVTGTPAGFTYGSQTVMPAASGNVSTAGSAASFKRSRIMSAGVGAINASGSACSLRRSLKLTSSKADINLVGSSVGVYRGRRFTVDAANISIVGQPSTFDYSRSIKTDTGFVEVLGSDVDLILFQIDKRRVKMTAKVNPQEPLIGIDDRSVLIACTVDNRVRMTAKRPRNTA